MLDSIPKWKPEQTSPPGPANAGLIRGLFGGGLLVFFATRLELESQLSDPHQMVLYVAAFLVGAMQVNLSEEITIAYLATVGLCVALAAVASSWAAWPWFVWVGIWLGLSIGIGTAFTKYPKVYKATLWISGALVLTLAAALAIYVWYVNSR